MGQTEKTRGGGGNTLEGFESQGNEFVLEVGVNRQAVEGREERCHMVGVMRKVDDFGSGVLIRKEETYASYRKAKGKAALMKAEDY